VAGNDEVAVYLAAPGALFARDPAARVPVKTSSHLITRDLTGSGRTDILMWYDASSDWNGMIKVLMNTGKGWARP
jgi:hypothetical protein